MVLGHQPGPCGLRKDLGQQGLPPSPDRGSSLLHPQLEYWAESQRERRAWLWPQAVAAYQLPQSFSSQQRRGPMQQLPGLLPLEQWMGPSTPSYSCTQSS